MRLRRFLGVALLIGSWTIALPTTQALAQSAPVTREEFVARIERAASLASDGETSPSAAQMAEVTRALGLPVTIEGTTQEVILPLDGYLDGLEGTRTEDFVLAGVHLESLRATIEAPAIDVDEGRVRATVEQMYRNEDTWDESGFIEGIWRAIERFFARLGEGIARPFQGDFRIGDGVAWLILLGVLGGLAILAWRLTRRFVPSLEDPADHAASDIGPEGWRQMAEAAFKRGDQREATRCLYRWLLADLAADGIVPDRVSLTAGETRAAVARKRPQLADPVTKATRAFERIAFAGFEPTTEDVHTLRAAIQEVTHP